MKKSMFTCITNERTNCIPRNGKRIDCLGKTSSNKLVLLLDNKPLQQYSVEMQRGVKMPTEESKMQQHV